FVDVGAETHGFLLNAGIDFRNNHDGWIDLTRILTDFAHEVRKRRNAKIDPFAKIRIGKIPESQVAARVEAGVSAKRSERKIVKARPGVLPSVEMGHPIWNIDIDAVDAGCCDLADSFHIDTPPRCRVGADPDVFIAFADPEGRPSGKDSWFAGNFPLQPFGVILNDGVRGLVCIGCYAFGSCDVDEG